MLSFNNKKEVINAINTVSNVEGLDKTSVKEALEKALATTFRSNFSKDTVLQVNIDDSSGEFQLFREWLVVDDNEENFSSNRHVYEDIAQEKYDLNLKIGDIYLEEIKDFNSQKRNFAKKAWPVFVTNIKEIHKNELKRTLENKKEKLILVNVKRYNNEGYIVEYNNEITGFLPRKNLFNENEKLKVGNSYFVVLDEETKKFKNYNIIFRKNNKIFIENIFKREVPEVSDELIEIKSIYHDVKNRKVIVAVHSADQKIDSIGCCVGSRGVRIQSISKHLNGEKIELINWNGNEVEFVSNILGSKIDIEKIIIEESKFIIVLSDEDYKIINKNDSEKMLSELICQNVEIISLSENFEKCNKENKIHIQHLVECMNLDEESAEYLIDLGLFSIDDILSNSVDFLVDLGLVEEDVNSLKEVAIDSFNVRKDFINSYNSNLVNLEYLNDYMIDILLKNEIRNIKDLAELSNYELLDILPIDEDYSSSIIMEARSNCKEDLFNL